jgi:hypothetical protein
MVKDVKATVDMTLVAVRQRVAGTQAAVGELVAQVKGSVGETVATVKRTVDLPCRRRTTRGQWWAGPCWWAIYSAGGGLPVCG